jgi:LemA protein
MKDSVVFWFAVAVLLFWAMGAYNRLMRLRSRGIVAFATLEGLFNQFLSMVKTNYPATGASPDLHPVDQGNDALFVAWTALAAAADQFKASLKVAHSQPLNGPTMSALRTAFETLCLSWLRLRNLPPDLVGAAVPETLQSQWELVAVQVEMARNEFNSAVTNYNEATNQFPALLLARVFGFKPAQPL